MSNKKTIINTRPPLDPKQIVQVAAVIKQAVTRRERRAFRRNVPIAAFIQDHHKPHDERGDCGPSCSR